MNSLASFSTLGSRFGDIQGTLMNVINGTWKKRYHDRQPYHAAIHSISSLAWTVDCVEVSEGEGPYKFISLRYN